MISLDDKILQIIRRHEPQDFKNFAEISSEGTALVHIVDWMNTKVVIKKLVKSSMKEAINEICLTGLISPYPNIITFYGVTKLEDEKQYSLVLEYADSGTLGKYLRDDTITFKWENQLKFAKEIASAILWLHNDKGVIHGDLHPNNILIHKDTIKLADFGRSCLKGSKCYNTEVWGVIPYVDPKMFDRKTLYKLNEKSDIYSLGVIFWELTSRSFPFNYETRDNHVVMLEILNGVREKPIPNTNVKFIELYQKCWEHEPDKRPNIRQVNSELNSIDSENNNNVCTVFYSKEKKTSEEIEIEDSDLSNCDKECDLNAMMTFQDS
ncbi:uncharacterized protein OCT59_029219 [Rhizophagus irregularis]|uniref:Ste7p n=4 Tax=Rhizophagus irregularis TaxID=588596 RepID=A0A015I9F7_RHIIW|nr:kinase-like domain-containing protein [Rhizophagus irregularis DAOM 181602=DAOM 197198]EXX53827.1 Ste7p [Rhizophagus irregularis DAOM 197198w]POG72305.1 kinase-like domain-containing protein [Rhizophagus irregularis DAOM 181602=DAOM 197198]UZO08977.1 hypothetical protein OCT59_029219 [Rhizophagus irregularis]GBC40745.1 kinase-like domain-containing protein [Rhizophagus irregularis DAOM 181602=DAOM 197198]|eukprot:XP_025179171.1 kinase-like domain-containing protein [Rhizophagus irregularis DAOM 181602=DAOM 197198]